MQEQFNVPTSSRVEFVDITSRIQDIVSQSGINDGTVTVFVPHTTAGVTSNENADPDVQRDIIMQLEKIVPQRGDYRHGEGNSPAHIKAGMMGSSVTIFVSGGRLSLGTWQGIYFCEFDGPRTRRAWVKTLEG